MPVSKAKKQKCAGSWHQVMSHVVMMLIGLANLAWRNE